MSMLYRYIHDQMRLAPGVPRDGGIDARCGGEGACCRWLKGLGVECKYGYGSIHTIFRGMNIHLPAILMFTRGIGF